MKNLVKISLIAVALFVVSCNKEVIRPNVSTSNAEDQIILKSASASCPNDQNNPKGDPGITDPNNDPDMLIKKASVIKPN